MTHTIERDWTTATGLRALCIIQHHHGGWRPSHRCGYVAVPPGHALHGVAPDGETVRPSLALDVHGGVTFARMMPSWCSNSWWIGFDCLHAGDGMIEPYDGSTYRGDGPVRDLNYVVAECESLAEQIGRLATLAPTQ